MKQYIINKSSKITLKNKINKIQPLIYFFFGFD